MDHRMPFTRRSVLATLTAGAAVTLAAPRIARAAGDFDWQKYKGTKLDVLFVKKPANDVILSKVKGSRLLSGWRRKPVRSP